MKFRSAAPRALAALLISAALVSGTGCNSDGPTLVEDTGGDVLGAWTAVSFAGSFLPLEEFVQVEDRGTCLRRLENVDLTFAGGGQYTWVEKVFLDCADSSPSTTTNTFEGTWRVVGVHLFLKASGETAEQDYTFTVKDNSLSMRAFLGNMQVTSVFERA